MAMVGYTNTTVQGQPVPTGRALDGLELEEDWEYDSRIAAQGMLNYITAMNMWPRCATTQSIVDVRVRPLTRFASLNAPDRTR